MSDEESFTQQVASLSTPSETPATVQPQPPDIAREQDILGLLKGCVHGCGVVGEERLAALVYLAMTSRVLDKPVSVAVKGTSSSGKSVTVETTARFFPGDAFMAMTAMSERALVYMKDEFAHRTIIVYEAVALRENQEGNMTAYLVRSLLSEGRIDYPATVRDKDGGFTTRTIVKEGPTNLIVTTTATQLEGENETRLISVPTNDSAEQTRAVMRRLAQEDSSDVDLEPWHQLQTWLAQAEHRVTIPYLGYLAENIPPVATRLRRDFGAIRSLIKAHAILHQLTRERDPAGRIVATEGDYFAIRELVADLVAEGVGATVSPTIRETVERVEELHRAHADGVQVTQVAAAMRLDKSTALRRVRAARERGYLANLEERRGRPGRYVKGDPLPDETELLPLHLQPCNPDADKTAGQGSGCTVASESEGIEGDPADNGSRAPAAGPGEDDALGLAKVWNYPPLQLDSGLLLKGQRVYERHLKKYGAEGAAEVYAKLAALEEE